MSPPYTASTMLRTSAWPRVATSGSHGRPSLIVPAAIVNATRSAYMSSPALLPAVRLDLSRHTRDESSALEQHLQPPLVTRQRTGAGRLALLMIMNEGIKTHQNPPFGTSSAAARLKTASCQPTCAGSRFPSPSAHDAT